MTISRSHGGTKTIRSSSHGGTAARRCCPGHGVDSTSVPPCLRETSTCFHVDVEDTESDLQGTEARRWSTFQAVIARGCRILRASVSPCDLEKVVGGSVQME